MAGGLFLLVVVALVCIRVGKRYASAIPTNAAGGFAAAAAGSPQRGKYQNV